jgi:long-chain fatty acid transport protein
MLQTMHCPSAVKRADKFFARMLKVSCAALCLSASPVFAGNGLNLIGFGAESVAMGGADVALAGDTSALNANPAGLARIRGKALDVYGAIAYGMDVGHADSFGNDRNVDNRWIPLTGGGYARALGDACTIGIGMFAQGGAGVVYDDLKTAFGTNDELMSLFRIAKFAPGGACRLTDKLAIGASLGITYADIRQKIFFQTSVLNPLAPASSFFGYEITDASSLETGLRFGVQYEIAPGTTLGATFSPQLDLPLRDGELVSTKRRSG